MSIRTIYLIRHGQYNSRLPIPDELERGLTELGHQQAALTASRVAHLSFNHLHSSDLRRASETAEPFAQLFTQLSWEKSALLRECIPYLPLGYESQFLNSDYSLATIIKDKQQAESAFDRFFQPATELDERDLIVTHGNLIRYFICRALNIPITGWLDMSSYNCGLTIIQIKANRQMRLYSFNDTGHLPASLLTHNMDSRNSV